MLLRTASQNGNCIKGQFFWVGQEGCGYVSRQRRGMKGNEINIPLCYRIPNGNCINRHEFLVGRGVLQSVDHGITRGGSYFSNALKYLFDG